MRYKTFFFFLLLGLMACTPAAPPPVAQTTSQPTTTTAVLPSPTQLPPTPEPQPATTAVLSSPTQLPPTPEPPPTDTTTPVTATATPAEKPLVTVGRTTEGLYFRGNPDAPITMIDYSDFLWGNCRAYVLSVEPEIVANYVDTGLVKLVFWPVLNHGDPSIYATLTAECIAQQNMETFWQVHELFFQNQDDLWGANRDYYVQTAVQAGVDQTIFESCYDGDGLSVVLEMDAGRRERGIFSQPVFDINGQLLAGLQSYTLFDQTFQALLP